MELLFSNARNPCSPGPIWEQELQQINIRVKKNSICVFILQYSYQLVLIKKYCTTMSPEGRTVRVLSRSASSLRECTASASTAPSIRATARSKYLNHRDISQRLTPANIWTIQSKSNRKFALLQSKLSARPGPLVSERNKTGHFCSSPWSAWTCSGTFLPFFVPRRDWR